MFFRKIKDYSLYIILSVFIVSNALLVGYDFSSKKIIISLFFLFTVAACFYNKGSVKEIITYFNYIDDAKMTKRVSGVISLASWLFFAFSLFLLNIGLVWFARWLILMFVICVLISGVLTFYDLEREGNSIFSKLKLVFVSGSSVLYFITSAYAASYFFRMSNMDISSSPLLEFEWKLAFFALYFFMLLQPISYGFFLWAAGNLKGHQFISALGVLMLTSFLLVAVPRWAVNFIVVVLDGVTNSEWRNSAMCGTLNINEPNERYFGFNTDKYTVYFSNRNGMWGFEEISCIKDEKNQDSLKRVSVSESNMPRWFKE